MILIPLPRKSKAGKVEERLVWEEETSSMTRIGRENIRTDRPEPDYEGSMFTIDQDVMHTSSRNVSMQRCS